MKFREMNCPSVGKCRSACAAPGPFSVGGDDVASKTSLAPRRSAGTPRMVDVAASGARLCIGILPRSAAPPWLPIGLGRCCRRLLRRRFDRLRIDVVIGINARQRRQIGVVIVRSDAPVAAVDADPQAPLDHRPETGVGDPQPPHERGDGHRLARSHDVVPGSRLPFCWRDSLRRSLRSSHRSDLDLIGASGVRFECVPSAFRVLAGDLGCVSAWYFIDTTKTRNVKNKNARREYRKNTPESEIRDCVR